MPTIRLKTSIPGPKSQTLIARSAAAVPRGLAQLTPIFVERAEGACVEDEHSAVEPDLITSAQSLGGGLPIAAVTGRAELMDTTGPGSLRSTFGGNPLSCEAALAAIRAIEENGLNQRAVKLGDRFRDRALKWRKRLPVIGDIRGLGAIQAFGVIMPAGHAKVPVGVA